ncbi:hypothetical protein C8F04DRAFT_1195813 [Mycena alexandri]|uniref:Uncharacterized protein n=1 Tax=Mycena alexandri TaxID=1745969 RepID=A0AAD6S596_9AGAR|nr:hypothetical protein C8F04DRAFT_1195813 [Mycena alexandri]
MGKINYPRNKRKYQKTACGGSSSDAEEFIKKYGFKAYWDHYKPLLNEFNHYCLPGVRVEVPKEEQKPTAEGEDNLTYVYYRTEASSSGVAKLLGAQNDGARGSCSMPLPVWLRSESKTRAQLPLSLDGVGHLALDDGVGLGVGLGLRLGDEADGDPWAWGAHYLNASDVVRRRRSGSGFVFGAGTGSALHLFAVEERGRWGWHGRVIVGRWRKRGARGRGGRLHDRDEPEYTLAMEIGRGEGRRLRRARVYPGGRDRCTPVLRDDNGSRRQKEGGGGADEVVAWRVRSAPVAVWISVLVGASGYQSQVLMASTRHIARGRGREPGDGVDVVQRRRHSREKKRSQSIAPTSGGRDNELEGSGAGARWRLGADEITVLSGI